MTLFGSLYDDRPDAKARLKRIEYGSALRNQIKNQKKWKQDELLQKEINRKNQKATRNENTLRRFLFYLLSYFKFTTY